MTNKKQNFREITYNKSIAIFQHDVSDSTESTEKSLHVFLSGMVRQTTNIHSSSHLESKQK